MHFECKLKVELQTGSADIWFVQTWRSYYANRIVCKWQVLNTYSLTRRSTPKERHRKVSTKSCRIASGLDKENELTKISSIQRNVFSFQKGKLCRIQPHLKQNLNKSFQPY